MDVKDAILSRRTIFKFKQESVPNNAIADFLVLDRTFSSEWANFPAPAERYVYSTLTLLQRSGM